MTTPDLLTLIRRACEGTAAEGLAPWVKPGHALLQCSGDCPHCNEDQVCAALRRKPYNGACEPAVVALAQLAVEGAAEVDRLTHPAWQRDFWGDVDQDPKSGWCQVHPRRVQADTGEMIGGDGDICLACEIERLTEALRVATAHPRVKVTRSVRPETVITDNDGDWTPEPNDPHVAHTLARWSGMAGQPGGPPAYPETANPSTASNGCKPVAVEPEPLPAGFHLRPGALCGGLGPSACRKPGTCQRRNECSYIALESAATMADAFVAGGKRAPDPAAVEGVELVWVPGLDPGVWCLAPFHDPNPKACMYDATDDEARVWDGDRDVETVDTGSTREGCRWIADRARAEGYRVPPHPLGWDVG